MPDRHNYLCPNKVKSEEQTCFHVLVPLLRFIVIVFIFFISINNALLAQNVKISSFEVIQSDIYYVADFDVQGNGNAADFFRFRVEHELDTDSHSTTICIKAQILANNNPLVEATTKSFLLTTPRYFTYRDFREVGMNADVEIEGFTYNTTSVATLTDALLQTGRLPDGIYVFRIEVFIKDESGGSNLLEERHLFVRNRTTLDLISPGARQNCSSLFTNLPQFKWTSEADEFQLTVCEELPTNSGPDDIMRNPPRLNVRVKRMEDFFDAPTFQYPPNALPLQEGKTYYWQVIAVIKHNVLSTTPEEIELQSPIWCFQVKALGDQSNSILFQQLLALLRSLGLNGFEELFRPGGPLEGYQPTGTAIINGQQVNWAALLAEFGSGNKQVRSFIVE